MTRADFLEWSQSRAEQVSSTSITTVGSLSESLQSETITKNFEIKNYIFYIKQIEISLRRELLEYETLELVENTDFLQMKFLESILKLKLFQRKGGNFLLNIELLVQYHSHSISGLHQILTLIFLSFVLKKYFPSIKIDDLRSVFSVSVLDLPHQSPSETN